jgi:hypothetical protein
MEKIVLGDRVLFLDAKTAAMARANMARHAEKSKRLSRELRTAGLVYDSPVSSVRSQTDSGSYKLPARVIDNKQAWQESKKERVESRFQSIASAPVVNKMERIEQRWQAFLKTEVVL